MNNINTLFEDKIIQKGHVIARAKSLSDLERHHVRTHYQRLEEKCEAKVHLETQWDMELQFKEEEGILL